MKPMLRKSFLAVPIAAAVMVLCAACAPTPSREQPTVTKQAIGTPMPVAVAKAIQVQPGTTGIFLFNQSAAVAQVVVSDTIATILPQQTFLFVLPPQDYELKIYRSDHLEAINRTETVSAGKTRFVYLMP